MSDIKVCVECKHFRHAGTRASAMCIRKKGKIHPVWGIVWKQMSPVQERLGIGLDPCGRNAKYFTPKEEKL